MIKRFNAFAPIGIIRFMPTVITVHRYLKEQEIPHIWHVDGNAHDDTEWANNLYLFVRHIFEE